jgi:hypothetical protein
MLVWLNISTTLTIEQLTQTLTYADPDVWLRLAVKADGMKYYKMVLCYVDDILCISMDPMGTMERIKDKFELKNNENKTPDAYLGGTLELMDNNNGIHLRGSKTLGDG